MSIVDVTSLDLTGVLLLRPRRFNDPRGYFAETYNAEAFAKAGVTCTFVQDNQSLSRAKNTIRGLHFQASPMAQAKLVRVLKGRIFDVAVDLRKGSASYGRWCAVTLSAEGGEQIFVPRGFAHGFCTLEPDTEVAYKVDNYYSAEQDTGVSWNDPGIGIAWPIQEEEAVLSEKDRKLPRLQDFAPAFEVGAA